MLPEAFIDNAVCCSVYLMWPKYSNTLYHELFFKRYCYRTNKYDKRIQRNRSMLNSTWLGVLHSLGVYG